MTQEGFRSAPTSLQSQLRSGDRNSDCIITDLGLRGDYWIVIFNEKTHLFVGKEAYRLCTPEPTFGK
jgi:hypothetical protein